MSFSSPLFFFVFLPFVITGHFLVPHKFRNLFLLLSSLTYYIFADIIHIPAIIGLIAVNYLFGRMLRRQQTWQRLYLTLIIGFNILVLIYFKYSAFIVENINVVLGWFGLSTVTIHAISSPLGLSFIIFQLLAYLIDINNEITEPQSNVVSFSLFVLFFSKITAGPIIRHNEVYESLSSRTLTLDGFVSGLKRFIIGLSKKVLIADVLIKTVNTCFSLPQNTLTTGAAWLAILCFSLQIYYDFSGYSDMAIGIGKMMGFTFQENFDDPYHATSVTDFWRRWHISLSTWLRDYLFIPVSYALMTDGIRNKIASGAFKAKYITAASILIVFVACGFWHGAAWTFVVWGLLHGLILGIESLWLAKAVKSWWRPLRHVYTLFILMVAWVFFRSPSLGYAIDYLKSMFLPTFNNTPLSLILPTAFTREGILTLAIAILFVLPLRDAILALGKKTGESVWGKMSAGDSRVGGGISYICYLTLLMLSLAAVSSTTYNPFLYGKF